MDAMKVLMMFLYAWLGMTTLTRLLTASMKRKVNSRIYLIPYCVKFKIRIQLCCSQ